MTKKHKKSIGKPPGDYEVGYKKPAKSAQFKKGVAANPTGVNKPKAVRAMEALSEKALQQVIELVMTGSMNDMKEALKNNELSVAHRIIIKAAIRAEKDGSFVALNEILNRAIGVVKTKIDHSSSDGSMSPPQSVNFYLPENNRDKTE